jgi:hypothetical protein
MLIHPNFGQRQNANLIHQFAHFQHPRSQIENSELLRSAACLKPQQPHCGPSGDFDEKHLRLGLYAFA